MNECLTTPQHDLMTKDYIVLYDISVDVSSVYLVVLMLAVTRT